MSSHFRHALLVALASSTAGLAQAQQADTATAASTSPLSFNAGVVSLYKFRGQDQHMAKGRHNFRPALQVGADYAFTNGFYLGNWNSMVRLFDPSGQRTNVEMDFYGGYKFNTGPLAWDLGALRYQYPGAGGINTTELYAGASYSDFTLKYAHTVSRRYFGLPDSRGTGYLNLAWSHPLAAGVTLNAAVGHTFMTSAVRQAGVPSYTDYSLGLGWDALPHTTVSAAVVGANQRSAYGSINQPRLVVGAKYTF